jgi:hypothetical protein
VAPPIKQISVKGLADFMTTEPARQRKILRDYKYPKDEEPRAKIVYYREARDRISVYHSAGHPVDWLHTEAGRLRTLAGNAVKGRTRTRLRHNVRALTSYANHFGSRKFEILGESPTLSIRHAGVRVTVVPDLYVRERTQEKIIKLEFSKDDPADQKIKVISQAMYEAAEAAGMGLTASGVLYLDVERGDVHRGARAGSRMRSNIEAACENISAIWDSI